MFEGIQSENFPFGLFICSGLDSLRRVTVEILITAGPKSKNMQPNEINGSSKNASAREKLRGERSTKQVIVLELSPQRRKATKKDLFMTNC